MPSLASLSYFFVKVSMQSTIYFAIKKKIFFPFCFGLWVFVVISS